MAVGLHNTHSGAIWIHPMEVWLRFCRTPLHLLHLIDFLHHFLILFSVFQNFIKFSLKLLRIKILLFWHSTVQIFQCFSYFGPVTFLNNLNTTAVLQWHFNISHINLGKCQIIIIIIGVRARVYNNHNYIKILESDWPSAALICVLIGQLRSWIYQPVK